MYHWKVFYDASNGKYITSQWMRSWMWIMLLSWMQKVLNENSKHVRTCFSEGVGNSDARSIVERHWWAWSNDLSLWSLWEIPRQSILELKCQVNKNNCWQVDFVTKDQLTPIMKGILYKEFWRCFFKRRITHNVRVTLYEILMR